MRLGHGAKLVIDRDGVLLALCTGADRCAEHEAGSRPLQEALSDAYASDVERVQALREGRPVTWPTVLERKRIRRLLPALQLVLLEGAAGGEPEAMLGYCRGTTLAFHAYLLRFPLSSQAAVDRDVVGAWSPDAFAIRVRGARYVAALQDFYAAIVAGHVAFAASFCGHPDMHGIVLQDTRHLGGAEQAELAAAQVAYENRLRLAALDRSKELMLQMARAGGRGHVGWLWPMWECAAGGQVVYGLQRAAPGDGDDPGPYTRDQLLDWAQSGFAGPLTRSSTAEA